MKIVIDTTDEDYERLKVYEKAPFCSLTSRVYEAIANGIPLDNIRAKIKEQIDYHDEEHRKYDSEEEFGISLGLELALAIVNKEVKSQESEDKE